MKKTLDLVVGATYQSLNKSYVVTVLSHGISRLVGMLDALQPFTILEIEPVLLHKQHILRIAFKDMQGYIKVDDSDYFE